MKRTFTGKTRIFLAVSGIIIAVALVMQICGVGLNLGIDFTGGSLLTYSVGENYDVEDVYEILEAAGYTEYQVTKIEPSEASINLRSELAAEEAAAQEAADEAAAADADEAAEETTEETVEETTEETTEETAEVEATAEPVEEAAAGILDTDKSGIENDGLTDLQIRLDLVDETATLDKDIAEGLKASYPNAEPVSFARVTNIMVNENDYDTVYAGGFVAEFNMGAEFDAEAATADIEAALTGAGYSIKAISGAAFDPEAEAAAAEETEETAENAENENSDEAAEDASEEPEDATATGTSLRVLVAVNDQTTQVRSMLETEMSCKYPDFVFVTIDHVSAVAGSDLIANAVKALLIAFVCMLIYIAIRFDFYSGVVALGALVHDVLIMCSFMVFFRGLYQTNSPFIAAVLTIVGYSINNTIIVFDRIRENAKKPGQTQMKKIDVVEMSVRQTLSRTANTTITTLITLVCLYIFGVDSIREFAFPLIVGMLAGTYSSIMLSGQVWAAWVDHRNAKNAGKGKAETENA